MKRTEYLFGYLGRPSVGPDGEGEVTRRLNDYASMDWELVTVAVEGFTHHGYFKREITT